MGKAGFLFVIVLLQIFQSSLCVHAKELESLGFIRCKKHELEALLKFKQSFTKDPLNRLSSWFGEDCCQWLGVTCDNVTYNVVKLNLRSQPHYYYDFCSGYDDPGCLPDSTVSLVSSGVSSALSELKLLTQLDLSGNNFSGSGIPEFIGTMRQLRYLNLSSCGFSGRLPPQLGNLTNLNIDSRCTDLGLHSDGVGWTSGLLKLQSLDMSGNDLSLAHDTLKVLNTLPALSALSLSYCLLNNSHLSEALLGNTSDSFFHTLQHLDLGSNAFEGPLPSVLKDMVSLRSLSLSDNNFNGLVPLWLRAMTRLKALDLSYNGFSYVEGGIMGIMGNPCNLKHLNLSYNYISQEDILEASMSLSRLPSFLGQFTNLNYLYLSYNDLRGSVPASFVNLSSLKYLDLAYNNLSGLIPDFIGQSTDIEYIDISSNSLQGTVFGIGNLSKLLYLDMSYNNLNLNIDSSFNWRPPFQLRFFIVNSCVINTGELPGWLWNSSNLQFLQLSGNKLTGSILCLSLFRIELDILGTFVLFMACSLDWLLDLHNNLLTGTIPKWLGNLKDVEVIDLSSNMVSGAIFEGINASSLFNIPSNLKVLDLGDNMLSGEIQFGKAPSWGLNLEILSLRGNHFNGHIPSQICELHWLLVLELEGSMPFSNSHTKGGVSGISDASLQIKEIVKGISIIDLSSNNLVGTIPKELTNISILFALNLSFNHLTGHIPENIGNLGNLESLDLSNNHLSGSIPQSLSSISWISYLNLSNNNLHGPIPTGRQLQTLDDPSIYAGNSGLCRFPLPNDCTKPNPPPSLTNVNHGAGKDEVEKKDKYEDLWFILAVMSGVATGFWGVVVTLVIKRSWRESYFRYVEDVANRIYVPIKLTYKLTD
ncbi:hypothetical protein RND81_14G057400 [Saponaria officinalis]|uniref:Leucine-rich repeat-containing N-terminal plant-type domain-containing protein n=1 Tax=Saponaria officinalis TaxID=3572 RepID=A0AAW1GIZ3_SAPOF